MADTTQGGQLILAGILGGLTLVSALGVVVANYESRQLFIELQALQERRDSLLVRWGQLQLEQSTWATHARVERLARERLDMTMPSAQDVVIAKP